MLQWFQRSAVSMLLIAATNCGGSSPTTGPPGPSPAPAGSYTVTGLVADLTGSRPIPNTAIVVTSGPNINRAASSDTGGRYSLSGLVAGGATLRATAAGYSSVDDSIVIPTNQHADFRLPAVGPRAGTDLCAADRFDACAEGFPPPDYGSGQRNPDELLPAGSQ